ncbi:RNA-directed DNA polymerase, eukaryota, reverse transcriptase zinc-binding domain protein [Tanacetum coccineum]
MESMELVTVKLCWGNYAFDYVHSDAVGNSGGILCVWDPNSFRKTSTTVSDYFVITRGEWVKTGVNLLVVAVYAPHDLKDKCLLWDYLTHVCNQWVGEVVMMGDFNEVRDKSERFGSIFYQSGADRFNSFISNAGLKEVMLGGCAYTWCHKSASKMSKLDRFLISENLMNNNLNICAITLDRFLSDHRPILLCESKFDYGPTPFRFFHYWMEVDGFNDFVVDTWRVAPGDHSNGMCNMMYKLKFLKSKIREWIREFNNKSKGETNRLKGELKEMDADIDKESDVYEAVKYFFTNGDIPKGCNSSLSPLIFRIFPGANMVKDFRPISLIGSIYKIIAKIMANRLVGVLGDIVSEVQSAFIKDRQILDGPFILNEVLHWCTAKKKKAVIFKVDFEKAYDSVRWDFLDEILKKFGFGNKWCTWIQNSLRSSRGSILINGSPTEEFQFFKGLKQGDPLSPFLFILIMESLHLSFQRVVDAGLFTGINLNSSLTLSHMFYADDAVFLGQWNDGNIDTLVNVLECFYRVSGLRINMSKSKIMGVHVEGDLVKNAASKLGCLILKTPFIYLGTKVGGKMSRAQEWQEVVDKVKDRLSKWKLKALSIGGRLTLLKSVLGSIPIFHMSIYRVPSRVLKLLESIRNHFFNGNGFNSKKAIWIKWSSVLADKAKGGLGVASLYALNRGLLIKWLWRFYYQNSALWVRVVKAIHGEDGKVGSYTTTSPRSCWLNIVKEVRLLSEKGINVMDYIRHKLGNGDNTLFWEDNWLNVGVLKVAFPRLYALECDKDVSVRTKLNDLSLDTSFRRQVRQLDSLSNMIREVALVPISDRFTWSLEGSGEFSVASIRRVIDDNYLPTVSSKTRWVKYMPIKVNILAWKVKMNALPLRFNISRRGIDIGSIICPVCEGEVETACHLFFKCSILRQIVRKISSWWDVSYTEVDSYEDWLIWLDSLRMSVKLKMMFEGVFYV